MGVVCYRVHHTAMVAIELLCAHELLTKTITTMWYLLTIILSVIVSFVAWAGEPWGAILFIPMIATGVWHEFNEVTK